MFSNSQGVNIGKPAASIGSFDGGEQSLPSIWVRFVAAARVEDPFQK